MDINFLHRDETPSPPSDSGPSFRGFFVLLLLAMGLLAIVGALTVIHRTKDTPFFAQLKGLLRSSDIALAGEKEDRINVLLLGIGGKGHDGGYLTDTILLASLQPSTGAAGLVSIPRDLVVPYPANEWRKINAVGAIAESANPGSGGDAVRRALAELLQIPIPYYARVDFQGFRELIDSVGGVTITVENRLDDPLYPIPGNEDLYPVEQRYQHVVFEKGTYTMDGATALQYARSRRGRGVEGSDFARTKRQQNVIVALKEKALSWGTLTSPARIGRMFTLLAEHITTNSTLGEAMRLFNIAKTVNQSRVHHATLSDATDGLLTARIANGAYILEPRDGTFGEVRSLVQNIFTKPAHAPAPSEKNSTVALLNGTTIPGLAKTISAILEEQGFTVAHIGNAPIKPIARTMVIDRTKGKEYLAYDRLRLLFDATPADAALAEMLNAEPPADFVIILGENTKLP